MRWTNHIAYLGEMQHAYRNLKGREMNLGKIGFEGMYWMHLAQDMDQWQALVNMVMNDSVLRKVGNFLTS
jgi:hypothetical protein